MSTVQRGGFFISFEHGRREVFQEAVGAVGRFSVELSISDWQPEERNFFLVSLAGRPGFLDFAAMGRRKRGPRNTGAHNFEFSDFVSFRPIKLSGLLTHLPSSSRGTIKEREGHRGLWFPPVAWAGVLQQIQKSRPGSAAKLEHLWQTVNTEDHYAGSADIRRLSMQRDAIGLSLDIAGLDSVRRSAFRKAISVSAAREVESFIELMDVQVPQERMLVDHDRSVMETLVAQGASADSVFSDGRRQLRVWTVDRGRIERDTGVDLVFLNRDFNSLLLLQYKCMEREADTSQWSYRPNRQFHLELERMQSTESLIAKRTPQEDSLKDIRLNLGSLYFKFCKRLPLSRQDGALAEGMLLSLATTEALLKDQQVGRNGKLKIGYETCDRFLNNTMFANLARDGWIGTRGLSSKDYRAILGFDRTNDSRSLVVAESISDSNGRTR